MLKALRKLKGERGITGSETAIILVAFVVAVVLGSIVLSARIFTQKAEETARIEKLVDLPAPEERTGKLLPVEKLAEGECDGKWSIYLVNGNPCTVYKKTGDYGVTMDCDFSYGDITAGLK